MRVALTGATGFIGQYVLRKLIAAGHSVRVLMRPPKRLPFDLVGDTSIEILLGGLAHPAILHDLCRDADTVIHCAGAIRARNNAGYFEVNSAGTSRIADAAVQSGARRLLLISSLAAREPHLSSYAASKAAGEAVLAGHDALLDWAIVRPPAVYGPGDRETGRLIRLAARGVLPVFASPAARFSLVYVEDLAAGIVDFIAEPRFAKRVLEPDDGAKGGYRWSELKDALSIALEREVRILRPPHMPTMIALSLYAGAMRLLGQAPLTGPEKLRELAHPDWVCTSGNDETAFVRHRRHNLAEGLRKTILAMEFRTRRTRTQSRANV